jgi:hypothetical protein
LEDWNTVICIIFVIYLPYFRDSQIGDKISFFVAGVATNDIFHLCFCIIFIQTRGSSSVAGLLGWGFLSF